MNILLGDEQVITRAGLKTILSSYFKEYYIFCAYNSEDFEKQFKCQNFDVAIIGLHPLSSFRKELVYKLQENSSGVKIMIISSDSSIKEINSLMENQISGFLTRECDEDEIVNAIKSITKGERFYCQKVINSILDSKYETAEKDCTLTILSQRELEVAKLIAEGNTNKQVAEKLFISSHTVHTHRKNLMKKLKVNSTSGIVKYAINSGLLSIN